MENEPAFLAITGRKWPPRLRRWEASEYLAEVHGITQSASTLAKKLTNGGGPEAVHVAGIPYYSTAALDAWVRDHSTKHERKPLTLEACRHVR
jgi:hypothetical protein